MSKSEFSRLSDLIPKLQREDEAQCNVALIDLKELRFLFFLEGVGWGILVFFPKKSVGPPWPFNRKNS